MLARTAIAVAGQYAVPRPYRNYGVFVAHIPAPVFAYPHREAGQVVEVVAVKMSGHRVYHHRHIGLRPFLRCDQPRIRHSGFVIQDEHIVVQQQRPGHN